MAFEALENTSEARIRVTVITVQEYFCHYNFAPFFASHFLRFLRKLQEQKAAEAAESRSADYHTTARASAWASEFNGPYDMRCR